MNEMITGTMQTANRGGKLIPYLKFDRAWQAPWGGWFVGGDAFPTDVAKWNLTPGNIDGRRFSAVPHGNTLCSAQLVEELIATTEKA